MGRRVIGIIGWEVLVDEKKKMKVLVCTFFKCLISTTKHLQLQTFRDSEFNSSLAALLWH